MNKCVPSKQLKKDNLPVARTQNVETSKLGIYLYIKLNVVVAEVYPPSTTRLCPVMNPASSLARKRVVFATLPRNKLPLSLIVLFTSSILRSEIPVNFLYASTSIPEGTP
ncbi:hypothetical protein SLE2022_149020 [Rubroshorea leprosula]